MSEKTYVIGIISKDRYDGLSTLLYSLRESTGFKVVIDVSDQLKSNFNNREFVDGVFYNIPDGKTAVVYNKNFIINLFLKSTNADYLFLIEDDVKILDCDVFKEYINASEKYNIPHMNFNKLTSEENNQIIALNKQVVYDYNKDIVVTERVHGAFQFYSRECLERVGVMNENLCNNIRNICCDSTW